MSGILTTLKQYRFSQFFPYSVSTHSWTCPAGVNEVILVGSGGGGGGGGAGGDADTGFMGGSGGTGGTGGNTTFVSGAVTRTFTGWAGGTGGAGSLSTAPNSPGSSADNSNIEIAGSWLNSIVSNRVGSGGAGSTLQPTGTGGNGGPAYATIQRVTVIPGNVYTITVGPGGGGGGGGGSSSTTVTPGNNGSNGSAGAGGAGGPLVAGSGGSPGGNGGSPSINSRYKATYAITQASDSPFDGAPGTDNTFSSGAGGGAGANGFLMVLWDAPATP